MGAKDEYPDEFDACDEYSVICFWDLIRSRRAKNDYLGNHDEHAGFWVARRLDPDF